MLDVLIRAVWYILPAYVANASAVIAHGSHPLDHGLHFLDGRRLLGKSKTMVGFFAGVLFGTIAGLFQAVVLYYLLGGPFETKLVLLALVLATGAMVGDSLGSFIKRRFDLKPGQATPMLDQWDFVLGAFLFVFLLPPLLPLPDATEMLVILVITPVLHVVSNNIAFRLKFKGVPW